MRPSQVARSQKNWLLEYLPEASIPDQDIESLLLDEIDASRAKQPPRPADTSSLFSVGEVADLRDSESAKGYPVLAVASGVSGNVLRLISLAREDWVWIQADIKVRLHIAGTKIEGEGCQGGVPISLVKFATDPRKHDTIRWLLVQNGASTTVYEPELRAIPMPTGKLASRVSGKRVANQIFDNELFTIPCDRTGGSIQTDVGFTRNPETDMPQLVIIDQAGNWSLWDVVGRRTIRPKRLAPVLRMCGNMISGSIPRLPSSAPLNAPQPHKVLCLALQEKPKASRRSMSSSRSLAPPGGPAEPETSRRLLLLCSPTALHLFDLGAKTLHSVSHSVLPKNTHRILGVAPSPLDPAQVFILTTTNLLWVVAKKGKKKLFTLDILASCPHQRNINDLTLRLDVSPGAYINNLRACFVCVRSANDTEMTVFWFISPGPGTPVQYHRDLISLNAPSPFIGLSILPAERRMGNDPESPAVDLPMRTAQLRFFQLLALGPGLDVHSALCAWSADPGVFIPPPDTRERFEDPINRRLKLLQSLTDAFTVPDEFDERAVFGKKGLGTTSLEGLKGGIQQRMDFGLVAQRLSAVGLAGVKGEDGLESHLSGVDFGFIAEAIEREKKDEYMPRRSLCVSLPWNSFTAMANNSLGWIWHHLAARKRIFFCWPANGMPNKKLSTDALEGGSLYPRLGVHLLILDLTTWSRDFETCFSRLNQAAMTLHAGTGKKCCRPWQPRCSSAILVSRRCRNHGQLQRANSRAPFPSPAPRVSSHPNRRSPSPAKGKAKIRSRSRKSKAIL